MVNDTQARLIDVESTRGCRTNGTDRRRPAFDHRKERAGRQLSRCGCFLPAPLPWSGCCV